MGAVPVFLYTYGRPFEYIVLGMNEDRVVVLSKDEQRCKFGIVRILPVLHESNQPIGNMTVAQACLLIQARIQCLRSSFGPLMGLALEYKQRMEDLAIQEVTRLLRLELSAIRIQRSWRRAISDPHYNACKQRLLREYYEFTME